VWQAVLTLVLMNPKKNKGAGKKVRASMFHRFISTSFPGCNKTCTELVGCMILWGLCWQGRNKEVVQYSYLMYISWAH
jgi:hypothetical protein